ncbi:type II CAAX prenyl endopeptidase Rce1 family protein [Chloroflexota bacterium]
MKAFGWWGVVYVSLLFAALHIGFLSLIDVAFVFAIDLFFGWAVNKTDHTNNPPISKNPN